MYIIEFNVQPLCVTVWINLTCFIWDNFNLSVLFLRMASDSVTVRDSLEYGLRRNYLLYCQRFTQLFVRRPDELSTWQAHVCSEAVN